jgi:bifunctional non-homologous end joining protein LigD
MNIFSKYKKKRNFRKTPEPEPIIKKGKGSHIFVVQKHQASHLHYDFRLEIEGVLKSWAVPKGPSLNPSEKRLAIQVEDHPYDYHNFEGIIPSGNYGAGTVMIWDEGVYTLATGQKNEEKSLKEGLSKGHLDLILCGSKLKGGFALVRMEFGDDKHWLLMKKKDEFASKKDVTLLNRSVHTGKTMKEIAND